MTSDRLGTDQFRLTQEFMSNMLGVRREGVNKAAGALQVAKLIHYSRGMITVLNRPRLQKQACHCYLIIKAESDQYLN
jgi:CRP-like cAMP-binding protein